ncbi:hypothetical protein Tco_0353137 [Tanacetum coccineum]
MICRNTRNKEYDSTINKVLDSQCDKPKEKSPTGHDKPKPKPKPKESDKPKGDNDKPKAAEAPPKAGDTAPKAEVAKLMFEPRLTGTHNVPTMTTYPMVWIGFRLYQLASRVNGGAPFSAVGI